MRILVLAAKPLRLQSGDGLRFVNVARRMRAAHSFELLCFAKAGQELDGESSAVFDRFTLLLRPIEESRSLAKRVFSSLSSRHFSPESAEMKSAVAAALPRCDLVLDIGGLMLGNLPPLGASPPVVVDSIDEPEITFTRALEHAAWSDKPRVLRTLLIYRRINRKISARVLANVYSSELDSAHYARCFPSSRVETIPNGVDAEYFHPSANPPDPNRIAFEGNMQFGPNIDAALTLCRDIMPLLWNTRAELRLELIGRDPTPEIRALASDRILVSGTLPDIREHLGRASVFVCPMRLGAGIKNKVLQAWAMALPVVASSQSIGGLDAREGENVLIRDEPAAFATAVGEVLSNPSLAKKLAANGRAIAIEKYSWGSQALRFERLFEELCAKRSGSAR
ncbi:MAG TPA: glycosyltransferase family 4 protein [Planctomycetota bacterium]|nr:glycosyltransferase family 4 protein [Planctomycetota bacterium]